MPIAPRRAGVVTLAIRDEQGADAAAVRALHCAAFAGSAEADLGAALTASRFNEISLVAIEEGAVVGHILFSRLEAPMPALALAPLAVDRELRRRGIGTVLVREGLARATEEGWGAVFVLGDPAYYARFGFNLADARGY